jgi:hypothetical protein
MSVLLPCCFIPRDRTSCTHWQEIWGCHEFVWLVWRKYLLPFPPIEPRCCNQQLFVTSADLYLRHKGKVKGKRHPITGHEGPVGEYRYSCTLSLTSALYGVGVQHQAPAALPPGKETQYPLYKRLGGPQGRVGRLRKISPPLGIDSRFFQFVASRYTACAIPAPCLRHV